MLQYVQDGFYRVLSSRKRKFIPIALGTKVAWVVVIFLLSLISYYIEGGQLESTRELEKVNYLKLAIIAPLIETIIFFFLISNVMRLFGASPFCIVGFASLFFGVAHILNSNLNGLHAIGSGIFYALSYEYFRIRYGHMVSFIFVFSVHAIWNSLIYVVLHI